MAISTYSRFESRTRRYVASSTMPTITAGKTSRHQVKRSYGHAPLHTKTASVNTSRSQRTSSLYLNLVVGRDLVLAVEYRPRKLLELAIVAGPGTHGLAGIGEARHV